MTCPFAIANEAKRVPQRQIAQAGKHLLLDRDPEWLTLGRPLFCMHKRGLRHDAHRQPHPVAGHEIPDICAGDAPAIRKLAQFECIALEPHSRFPFVQCVHLVF